MTLPELLDRYQVTLHQASRLMKMDFANARKCMLPTSNPLHRRMSETALLKLESLLEQRRMSLDTQAAALYSHPK